MKEKLWRKKGLLYLPAGRHGVDIVMSFVSMDIDEMENLAEPLGLVGVPTYLIFKDGREVGRIIGYNQKKTFYDEVDKILGNKEK